MVKVDFIFLDDEKVCGSITKHVNEVVTEIIGSVIQKYETLGAGNTKKSISYINKFFPKGYPLLRRDEALYGLRTTINSESEYSLTLIQQFILKQMLIQREKELKKAGHTPAYLMPNRKVILEELERIYKKKNIRISAEAALSEYENLEYLSATICQDVEFEFIETYDDIIEEERHIG